MKIYLTILLSLLFVPVFVFAAYTDVSIADSTIIHVGGYDLTVSGTGSVDSIAVDSGSFVVILSNGASLSVVSADKLSFGVDPDQYKTSFTCGSNSSTLNLANSHWDTAAAVTVSLSSVCSAATVSAGSNVGGMIISGGGGGGGGGGGAGYTAPVATQQIVQAPTTAVPKMVSVSPFFTKALSFGNVSSDVKRLQQILNSDSETTVSAAGAGSTGKETTYFGPATKAALQKFQCKYNIVCLGTPSTTGYGNLGPKTRAKIQEVFKQQ